MCQKSDSAGAPEPLAFDRSGSDPQVIPGRRFLGGTRVKPLLFGERRSPIAHCVIVRPRKPRLASTGVSSAFRLDPGLEAGRGVEKHSNGMPPNLLAHYFYLWEPTVIHRCGGLTRSLDAGRTPYGRMRSLLVRGLSVCAVSGSGGMTVYGSGRERPDGPAFSLVPMHLAVFLHTA